VGGGLILIGITSASHDDTFSLAESIGRRLTPGVVILLKGELGAGKTVFAKGLGKGLGIDEEITSPSYNLMLRYNGRMVFDHWDLYRVGSIDNDEEFLESIYDPGSVKAIEWADKLTSEPDMPIITIELEIVEKDSSHRSIRIVGSDELIEQLIKPAIGEWQAK
jgi:tRNA threonylcarbamoyladenosine biosynthesis protein TsaE